MSPFEYISNSNILRETILLSYEFLAARTLAKGEYDVVILDEINVALHFGLVTREDCEALIAAKPAGTELVFTGRKAPQWLVDRADLVTEMRNVKHYYDAGVANRRGIED